MTDITDMRLRCFKLSFCFYITTQNSLHGEKETLLSKKKIVCNLMIYKRKSRFACLVRFY